ncbi:aminoglycoside phosphotransferase family protein [Streptomyces lunaelactis]|uniref:phosphotransferase family protein n=1 Tax=Streptomyces lunaelactis TaxID=1535768 RepID=UPI001584AA30|nr:aminoglycoside phosphotransferase family protein [Streptomyces lunaelactis]NUK52685.1 aminoglycoside phosphotransferase family protein [Streptomyces lunaelactis]NUK66646.1 aminoglycoside phosphotransferase family protein [Streptomyces lunaelactis]
MRSNRMPFGERLRDELGTPRSARLLDSSPRSAVWRVELADGPAVVKQLVPETSEKGDVAEAEERYARELAALRMAARVRPAVVPGLLGTDEDERVLVLEYVEHRRPREGWEAEYATALARLHAADTGDAGDVLPRWAGPDAGDIASFLVLAGALAVDVPRGVEDELGELVLRLRKFDGRRALLHGDPCPGNDLHTADGIRFVDFEQACLGNGLMELAYLRIGFPTCWCVTAAPEPLLAEAEAAYRSAWRAATGTEVEGDLADACAGWLIRGDALVQRAHRGTADQLARVVGEDWEWGTVSARERLVHRLGVMARTAEGSDSLDGLGRLSTQLRGRMLERWPGLGTVPSRRP